MRHDEARRDHGINQPGGSRAGSRRRLWWWWRGELHQPCAHSSWLNTSLEWLERMVLSLRSGAEQARNQ